MSNEKEDIYFQSLHTFIDEPGTMRIYTNMVGKLGLRYIFQLAAYIENKFAPHHARGGKKYVRGFGSESYELVVQMMEKAGIPYKDIKDADIPEKFRKWEIESPKDRQTILSKLPDLAPQQK